jgi:hypothetical protein
VTHAFTIQHGLAPCYRCHGPVAGPPGLFGRKLFHLPRCPHCGACCPHPGDLADLRETRRVAALSGVLLLVALAAVQFGGLCEVVSRLPLA